MATLGKTKLINLIKNQDLVTPYIEKNIKSASYDLRIGTIYQRTKIYSKDHNTSQSLITVKPSEIVTILTLEIIKIPNDCVGTVFAINKMSSNGFLILNPGHIDPGYNGLITICGINLSNQNIYLDLEDSIFTLIIDNLDEPLQEKDLYPNNNYDPKERKKYEKEQFKSKFSKLSNSFFDLIVNHKDGINLFKLIFKQSLFKIIKIIFKILVGIAALYGVLQFFNSIKNENRPIADQEEKNILSNEEKILFKDQPLIIDKVKIKDSILNSSKKSKS